MNQGIIKIKGFHLIEILIVITIISIITFIGLPNYSHYLVDEKRLEAAGMLSKLSIAMEQYRLEHETYKGVTLTALKFPQFIVKDHYRLTIKSATDDDYILTAKPLGEQAVRDKCCATLIIDSHGKKEITGSGKIEDCW